jgi:hypothetical protein
MEISDALKNAFQEVIRFTQTADQIFSAMKATRHVLDSLIELDHSDPEIQPELKAAGQSLLEATAALERAAKFANTRLEVRLKEITDNL